MQGVLRSERADDGVLAELVCDAFPEAAFASRRCSLPDQRMVWARGQLCKTVWILKHAKVQSIVLIEGPNDSGIGRFIGFTLPPTAAAGRGAAAARHLVLGLGIDVSQSECARDQGGFRIMGYRMHHYMKRMGGKGGSRQSRFGPSGRTAGSASPIGGPSTNVIATAPRWRHSTFMANSVLEKRSRQSLRLEPEVWALIDRDRSRRPGLISRNTWITEAILEKLARKQDHQKPGRASNA